MSDSTTPIETSDASQTSTAATGCPVHASRTAAESATTTNQRWWPNQLNLQLLVPPAASSSPMAPDFDYAEAFNSLDLDALKADVMELMTTSQSWWPADYGHYGPLFVRMAWHSAGTYRVGDGRGGAGAGMLRFAPLNSWPDNANLDKARLLLWPIKQKYGEKISWADLMVFAGNCAIESMGLQPFGFGGGREDAWAPEDVDWGPEVEWLADQRYQGDRELDDPLGAVQMGLIYVNPQGPNGVPDILASARDIRETFGRMAMDDEETVALIAGGHTFGKAHGAADAAHVGVEPEGGALEQQGLGWSNSFGTGRGVDTITSGLEGAWTTSPITWDNEYFENLFGFEWEQTTSPAGAIQWRPVDGGGADTVPDAHVAGRRHAPVMFTTDLALRFDPVYGPISKRFLDHPEQFADAFARAWFKLTHRDMGPAVRLLGPLVPTETLLWQDPVPAVDHPLIGATEIAELKAAVLAAGVDGTQLVATAWASAASFRGTDKRGGANGARIRHAPQRDWAANNPDQLAAVLAVLEGIRTEFNNAHRGGVQVSLADLIVLAGGAAIEQAAQQGGHTLQVPFTPGRTDATQEMTDVESFAVLEPTADGFRNYSAGGHALRTEHLLVERARLLTLTAPEMTVLVGGLRALGVGNPGRGALTDRPGVLSNEFFVNLLDMSLSWQVASDDEEWFVGRDRSTGDAVRAGSRVDLVFGSNSQLRALAEVYASADAATRFVTDFVAAWVKVMNLDRFDV
jgi:catalase-peroxidase